jgi:hypothetical protein
VWVWVRELLKVSYFIFEGRVSYPYISCYAYGYGLWCRVMCICRIRYLIRCGGYYCTISTSSSAAPPRSTGVGYKSPTYAAWQRKAQSLNNLTSLSTSCESVTSQLVLNFLVLGRNATPCVPSFAHLTVQLLRPTAEALVCQAGLQLDAQKPIGPVGGP